MSTTVQYSPRRSNTTHLFPGFPHDPSDWAREIAEELAYSEGLTLTAAHWRVARAMQQLSARGDAPAVYAHELRKVLEAYFHPGGSVSSPRLPARWA